MADRSVTPSASAADTAALATKAFSRMALTVEPPALRMCLNHTLEPGEPLATAACADSFTSPDRHADTSCGVASLVNAAISGGVESPNKANFACFNFNMFESGVHDLGGFGLAALLAAFRSCIPRTLHSTSPRTHPEAVLEEPSSASSSSSFSTSSSSSSSPSPPPPSNRCCWCRCLSRLLSLPCLLVLCVLLLLLLAAFVTVVALCLPPYQRPPSVLGVCRPKMRARLYMRTP
mmetsp:Transcript_62682/g.125597  ORF Transcript_62682/g.125597 Transcript_62682/m.125597 type:complete len:234 (+) Transcript_62682:1645-2346(+)